ncbi:CE1759 family FMN reductase [Trueperella bialowiezensis]|uniref:FMN reductase (NADPH) n=1 Tax=Trueperella bialowiezensis TaxID=312285 RepID=A0A448PFX2_9ACTO|nr:CE1759 family FMN reductase [Trueperella bialowiezensis]VEI13816.1 FMN reductase (NADPH) [Trueperella bialowiezensis]
MRIVVISASLSESSTTHQLGEALAEATADQLGASVSVISLREHAHGIVDAMLTGFPNQALEAAFDDVKNADAVVAVTPAYNASYSGLFKAFFDVLPEETLRGKPVAIGATGGTPRHSLVTEHAIRPMFTYLHAITAPTAVYAATEDFGAHAADSDGTGAGIRGRIDRTARELAAIVQAVNPSAQQGIHGTDEAQGDDELDAPAPEADIAAARELFEDFKPMDELFG